MASTHRMGFQEISWGQCPARGCMIAFQVISVHYIVNHRTTEHSSDRLHGEWEQMWERALRHSLVNYISLRRGSEFSAHTVPSALKQTLLVLRQMEFFPMTSVINQYSRMVLFGNVLSLSYFLSTCWEPVALLVNEKVLIPVIQYIQTRVLWQTTKLKK